MFFLYLKGLQRQPVTTTCRKSGQIFFKKKQSFVADPLPALTKQDGYISFQNLAATLGFYSYETGALSPVSSMLFHRRNLLEPAEMHLQKPLRQLRFLFEVILPLRLLVLEIH